MTEEHLELMDMAKRLVADGDVTAIRKRLGFSIQEVRIFVGVSASTVRRWERGLATPRGKDALTYGRFLRRVDLRDDA